MFFIALFASPVYSQCPTGNSEVIIQIVPDAWPTETSWTLTDMQGNQIAAGNFIGDTVCVPTSSCLIFTIYDSFGDGIYLPGGYWLYVDGILVANGAAFGSMAQHQVNCPPGMYCGTPLQLSTGNHTAPYDNTFYVFTAPQTGTYNITTCGMNTCNTKIWVYTNCSPQTFDEGPPGTYAYNDDAGCGLQADLNVVFMAGQIYYIRIGDALNDCPGAVDFNFSYVGPIQGCTDPLACNFNPLAVVDDGSCIYAPNPGCTGPDLKFDSLAFVSSLTLMTITAGTCDVNEGCVTGYGTRYVIAFTSKIDNIGNLPYIVGSPSSNPGMFNTVNCHGHVHYESYGDYRMYDTNGDLIPVGHKNGFCVMDLCGWGTYNCGYMGISAGCYDVYGLGTQCQWVDITDVPDGQYRLAVIVNARHLPDAFGKYETNHVNNAVQVCIQITRDAQGVPSYSLLPNCTPFVDCMGIPGGAAIADCNGICAGSGIYGNLNNDMVLDTVDVMEYAHLLENNPAGSTLCNDLNGDGELSVYDAVLAQWCINTPHHPHPAGSNFNDCNFPRNILNPNDTAGLAITNVNFTSGYMDIEMLSKTADIRGFQFSVKGITPTSVVSLADPVEFPVDLRLMNTGLTVFALSHEDSVLSRSNSSQPLCRIYFSAVTDTIICIDNIRDIVNQDAERAVTYIYGGCVPVIGTGLTESASQVPLVVMPNPVSGNAWLQLPANMTVSKVEIFDIAGRLVMTPNVKSGKRQEIDLSKLPSASYILKAHTPSGVGVARFSKL